MRVTCAYIHQKINDHIYTRSAWYWYVELQYGLYAYYHSIYTLIRTCNYNKLNSVTCAEPSRCKKSEPLLILAEANRLLVGARF